ncbi:MAG: prepilin-type N-terminal cleavage/methylation domain-containing protein (plasmid) [Candidatus Manganitrophus sp.]|nr:prepilin-type N-terminal cleavage/methylation domain-containing protein [Candidatus Manganitrophus sp.]MDC4228357.1 prepilin-type N-terminal cleavage/methylation domain-containing protein [Candidatus Manganitrophus sp.]WDT73385.1 MAG: prepilin-type N-terminal cleavage/methylation domain-containing protein [Candidatus Manganitrophus sp.]WDT77979.1 MAG: prepilin-type N-terminal cleavage/methylation domain-containing protein [Candidatus Manganitrophus sp.]WDT82765.1 MAG: prepilin-type N-termina
MIFNFLSKEKGYTLIEVLVSMVLTAMVFGGTLMIVRNIRAVDSGFEEMAGLYEEVGKINRMLREDLAGIQKSVDMEAFTDDNQNGFFNGTDPFTPADDPSTVALPHAFGINRNEGQGFPGDDSATPYDESAVDAINLPYGPAYDYFFGMTNNGIRDLFSFRGSVQVGGEIRPAMITYRLVERSHRCNGDAGTDGLSDEFETGYHPLYHADPSNDNVSGVFNPGQLPPGRVETEGDRIIDIAFPCPDAGAKPVYQLQRIMHLAPQEQYLEVLSTAIVEFNLLYFNRKEKRYQEPSGVKRFGYPEDFGSLAFFDGSVFRFKESTFGSQDPFSYLQAGSRIFLFQRNPDRTDPLMTYTLEPGFFTISGVDNVNRTFTTIELLPVTLVPNEPVTFGSLGVFDSTGLLNSAAVDDGFLNLKPGDEVYLEQSGAISPGLYRITEIRGGLRFDLRGQGPASGPVLFRVPYLPSGIKVHLTVKGNFEGLSDPRVQLRTIPITLFLGRQG